MHVHLLLCFRCLWLLFDYRFVVNVLELQSERGSFSSSQYCVHSEMAGESASVICQGDESLLGAGGLLCAPCFRECCVS